MKKNVKKKKPFKVDVTYVGKVFFAFVNPKGENPIAIIRFYAYYKTDNLVGVKTDMQRQSVRCVILSLDGEDPKLNIYSLKQGDMVQIEERIDEENNESCIVTNLTLNDEPDIFFNAKGMWD